MKSPWLLDEDKRKADFIFRRCFRTLDLIANTLKYKGRELFFFLYTSKQKIEHARFKPTELIELEKKTFLSHACIELIASLTDDLNIRDKQVLVIYNLFDKPEELRKVRVLLEKIDNYFRSAYRMVLTQLSNYDNHGLQQLIETLQLPTERLEPFLPQAQYRPTKSLRTTSFFTVDTTANAPSPSQDSPLP